MFLGNTLSAATSGLDSIERQIALLSQNVANASTPNYVRETLSLSSLGTAGGPAGVRTGLASRAMDDHLQGNLFASVATEAGGKITSAALAGIDQISGTPGSGQDLSSLFGNLQDSFSTLANDPASGSQQLDVIARAGAFTEGLHTVADAVVQARQGAHDALVQGVATANDTLHAIGLLTSQIVASKASGQSTADLENQRDGELRTLAQVAGAKFTKKEDGSVQVIAGNSVLPLHATSGPFTVAPTNISGGTPASSIPAVQLNGAALSGFGGEIGANLALRDTTLPALQAKLDGFAQAVSASFQAQGLPLFTDPSGAIPASPTAGYALTIQVSSAVTATPSIVRDGTTPSPVAGDTTLINNVLSNVFSSSATGLPEQATSIVAGFAQLASQADSTNTTNKSLRTGLESRLSAVTGVSVDSELAQLVQLQSAYAANAKVVTATQSMWTQLLGVLP